MRQTLRCTNDAEDSTIPLVEQLREAHLQRRAANGQSWAPSGRLTSGRVGACARDLVGECRRCGIVVCRVSIPLRCNAAVHLLATLYNLAFRLLLTSRKMPRTLSVRE